MKTHPIETIWPFNQPHKYLELPRCRMVFLSQFLSQFLVTILVTHVYFLISYFASSNCLESSVLFFMHFVQCENISIILLAPPVFSFRLLGPTIQVVFSVVQSLLQRSGSAPRFTTSIENTMTFSGLPARWTPIQLPRPGGFVNVMSYGGMV